MILTAVLGRPSSDSRLRLQSDLSPNAVPVGLRSVRFGRRCFMLFGSDTFAHFAHCVLISFNRFIDFMASQGDRRPLPAEKGA